MYNNNGVITVTRYKIPCRKCGGNHKTKDDRDFKFVCKECKASLVPPVIKDFTNCRDYTRAYSNYYEYVDNPVRVDEEGLKKLALQEYASIELPKAIRQFGPKMWEYSVERAQYDYADAIDYFEELCQIFREDDGDSEE